MSTPPVAPLSARARILLRATILAAWATGVGGVATSCGRLQYYRHPPPAPDRAMVAASTSGPPSATPGAGLPSATSVAGSPSVTSGAGSPSVTSRTGSPSVGPSIFSVAPLSRDARNDLYRGVLERHRRTRVPLAIANLLLSMALVVGAARTLARRGKATIWLRQMCVASAVLVIVEWVVARAEREDLAEVTTRAVLAATASSTGGHDDPAAARSRVHFWYATVAVFELTLYGGLAIALGRASVRYELRPRDTALPRIGDGGAR